MAVQVIVAVEPRAFREVVSGALRLLRPGVVVHPVTGRDVGGVLETVDADLVIASHAEESLSSRLRWLVCGDPAGGTLLAPTGATGLSSFDFSTLLSVVDGLGMGTQTS